MFTFLIYSKRRFAFADFCVSVPSLQNLLLCSAMLDFRSTFFSSSYVVCIFCFLKSNCSRERERKNAFGSYNPMLVLCVMYPTCQFGHGFVFGVRRATGYLSVVLLLYLDKIVTVGWVVVGKKRWGSHYVFFILENSIFFFFIVCPHGVAAGTRLFATEHFFSLA